MIPKETNKPKIRHGKRDVTEKQKIIGVVRAFAKVMESKALKQWRDGMEGWDNPENLLDLRKALVGHIEKGMLERKDGEDDIALLACFIWYNRLEDQRKAELSGEMW